MRFDLDIYFQNQVEDRCSLAYRTFPYNLCGRFGKSQQKIIFKLRFSSIKPRWKCLLSVWIVFSPNAYKLVQVMGAQNTWVSRQIIKIVHDDGHEQIQHLQRVWLLAKGVTISICNMVICNGSLDLLRKKIKVQSWNIPKTNKKI